MTLTTLLVPTYVQMLEALSRWLTKAQAQLPGDAAGAIGVRRYRSLDRGDLAGDAADALLTARLAPDMFPLATQIRFACVQAQEGLYRLRGEEFPPQLTDLLDEGRNAGDHPGTMADAQARLAETIALVKALAADMATDDPHRPIAHALPIGLVFDLSADQYARDWAIPQFYFHVMTAYALLRQAGVELGKADYVAHMLPFARPGTLPAG